MSNDVFILKRSCKINVLGQGTVFALAHEVSEVERRGDTQFPHFTGKKAETASMLPSNVPFLKSLS